MAIHRNIRAWNAETKSYDFVRTDLQYVGRVLSIYHEDYRAMSDVYTTATFAEVLHEDGHVSGVEVNANFECDTSGDHAEVDATDEAKLAAECYREKVRLAREAERAKVETEYKARREEEERNRPVLGKKMVVVSGRKVQKGTMGTVAFVSVNTGKVLLKDDDKWRDRQADGVWVDPHHLKARAT